MAPMSLSSVEIRMKILSGNYYNFKKLSVLTQTISFLFNCAYLENVFLTILTAIWNNIAAKSLLLSQVPNGR